MTDDLLAFARTPGAVDIRTTRAMQFTPPGGPECPVDGYSPAAPPRGFNVQDAPPVRLLFPPRVEKLSASRDFNVNDYRVILPAGIGASVEPATLAFQVPKDQVGWLQNFSQYTLAPGALTYASWMLLINGAPVSGYDDVRNPPGIANLVEVFESNIRIRIPPGGKVSVRITNIDGSGPVTVGSLIRGWYHPLASEIRAWGIDP